ncbi:hypothetical protein [uncultured Flavonifractor sp.]|uniref:hypothetical protein n=1 Tax=uncultured Flavonifractor sp. TaxID=1193534 RepID=UPI00261DCCBE|nr:hypothetical protein [uncultured Flavonifractor sp.]
MSIELTSLSANEYDRLLSGQLTPAMAAEYLKEERISLRSFADTLRELYPYPDLQTRLINAFLAGEPEAKPDSVSRKVRNWLSGQNRPTNREEIFRIAFALDLSEAQASYLLGLCTDYGIHYREGRDVVYAWFLRTDRGYGEAREFYASLPPAPWWDQPLDNPISHVTYELRGAFNQVQTVEELRQCYLAHLDQFGMLHMRAYTYVQKYLDQLIHPASALGGLREPDYSLEAVMDSYLSLKMPSGKDRQSYSLVQKLIKRNWPNTTALKNIRSQKEDVPRKLLLLLYVITENIMEDGYSEMDEEYISPQEKLEDHWWSLNAILTDCGMPTLDPRNATDWLVLYAITASEESMSERMEQVIDGIFSDVAPN